MDKDTKMSLIKGLLAGQLTKKQRRSYADLESVDRELKIQWNESENKAIDFKIKEQIWEKVKARCVDRKRNSSNRTQLKLIIRIDFEDIIKGKKVTLL